MARKIQLPAIGGLRKTITIPDATDAGTTIAEFGAGTITLAQLKAALGVPSTSQVGGGGGAAASLVTKPPLVGGGTLVGAVSLGLTGPLAVFFEDGGGGGDGDPGPPGVAGKDAAGAQGPMGPAVFMSAADGEDGWHAVPGRDGSNGATGAGGPNGPGIFMSAEDGLQGDTTPGPMGPQGAPGAAGTAGTPGPATFIFAEDGEQGDPGPPGPAGSSSGGGGGLTLIGSTIAGGAVASLTVSSIPNTYSHLLLVYNGRGDAAAVTNVDVRMQFNGDTGANYNYQQDHFVNSATSFSEGISQTFMVFENGTPASTATAGRSSVAQGLVPNYKNTTFQKVFTATAFAGLSDAGFTDIADVNGGVWKNTAAITSISIFPASGNFVAGSGFWVYGIP